MKRYPGLQIDIEADLTSYKVYAERFRPLMRDTITYLSNALSSPNVKTIVVEG